MIAIDDANRATTQDVRDDFSEMSTGGLVAYFCESVFHAIRFWSLPLMWLGTPVFLCVRLSFFHGILRAFAWSVLFFAAFGALRALGQFVGDSMLCRRALGSNWNSLTRAQRSYFRMVLTIHRSRGQRANSSKVRWIYSARAWELWPALLKAGGVSWDDAYDHLLYLWDKERDSTDGREQRPDPSDSLLLSSSPTPKPRGGAIVTTTPTPSFAESRTSES